MTRKTSQQHRKAPLDRVRADRGNESPFSLSIGPPPRFYARPDWPEMVAAARIVWDRCRETMMAEHAAQPGLFRPFGYFAFDRPPEETAPGPVRDTLLAEGRLTESEAGLTGGFHVRNAYAAIEATGSTVDEWIAAPKLAARTVALIGWNPFTPQTLADLRETEEERDTRRYQADADADPGHEVLVISQGVTTTYRANEPPRVSGAPYPTQTGDTDNE